MRVPVAWLRDYVDLPDDAGEIVARLAALGFPVDEVEERPALSGVVVGRIAELARHPNADRLQVCTVDVGADRALTIATAATNVAQGQVVPVARIGAHLAGGLTIAPRTMRGIDSEGMLISAEEVGLPGEWFEDGIMQLESATPIGADAIALLRLTDPVLDVEVTPNRPDALAIVGLARELAASFGIPLREPSTDAAVVAPDGPEPRVTIETFDCRRFVFQRARGLRVGPAPAWMRVRLALAGQRPIDNVVDVSNFVMLELGQPLHFFDDARIANGHLTVRDAREGERFTTLDTVERELDPRAIVICDDDGPTSLAGIMGGRRSEVSAATTDVLIEAASWSGPRVRRASTALKLRTEASSRFEKSLPLALAELGAARAAHLLAAQGALLEPRHVAGAPAPAPRAVRLAADAAQRLLGFEVSPDDAQRALGALGFATVRERDDLLVTPPYWRDDVAIAADVVEELARMIGYDRVRADVPPVAAQDVDSAEFDRETELATTLAGLGYTEAFSLSLQSESVAQSWRGAGVEVPAVVEIRNPLSEDQRWMRFSLAPALLGFAGRDRGVRPYRLFELGRTFSGPQDAPLERVELTVLHAGGDGAFGRLKSDVLALLRRVTGAEPRVQRGTLPSLHPGKTAVLSLADTVAAYVGVIDPRLARLYEVEETTALATVLVASLPLHVTPRFVAPPKFPAIERDLAVVVALDVAAGDLVAAARLEPLVRSAVPFDEYRGPQVGETKKSIALRIRLQSDEATLTDDDADNAIARVADSLRKRFDAEPRR